VCVCEWVCAGCCFSIFVGSKNWESTILVGYDSFVRTKLLDPTSLNCCLRVRLVFRVRVRDSFVMVKVKVRGLRMHYASARSP